MRVAYFDIDRKPAHIESALRATFYPTLESLLEAADCVVLCVPGTKSAPGCERMITASTLRHLKLGARFVNIARGSLVDEEALADAIESGRVGAAALDVHADEPRVNKRLVAMATGVEGQGVGMGRVMLTCHNAGGTVDTHAGFEELSMRNILRVLKGEEAITAVNLGDLRRN